MEPHVTSDHSYRQRKQALASDSFKTSIFKYAFAAVAVLAVTAVSVALLGGVFNATDVITQGKSALGFAPEIGARTQWLIDNPIRSIVTGSFTAATAAVGWKQSALSQRGIEFSIDEVNAEMQADKIGQTLGVSQHKNRTIEPLPEASIELRSDWLKRELARRDTGVRPISKV